MKNSYFWELDGVRLRPYHADDWEKKYAEMLDSDTRRLLMGSIEPPCLPETLRRRYAHPDSFDGDDDRLSLAIESAEGKFAGWISLYAIDRENGTFSLSFGVFPEYRRRGLALTACRMALRYAFWELRLMKCNSACLEDNTASAALHAKLGFLPEGRRRRTVFTGGRYRDQLLFGLTSEEFNDLENRHNL